MKKFIKNNYLTILSFLIPFIIMSIIFTIKEVFIKNNVGVSDMISQYIPFFNFYRSLLDEPSSIIYTFKNSLGGSMYGTFFYYLSSPLNILFLIFKNASVLDILPYLITLKISLCGLTMFLYLKNHYKINKFSLLIFSSCYALMAYNINYYFNIMWLDGVYLLPLILLGLDKLIQENKISLYSISLFLAIISNYYIAYMICIFLVLYLARFLILNYHSKEETIKILKRFIITSLLVGLICSFALIPSVLELASSSKSAGITKSLKLRLSPMILSKMFIGTQDFSSILNSNYMCIYSGIIILPLVFFYFTNDKITLKEKIVSIVIISLMLLPYFIPLLNMVWHGFNFPICFNYRYSFMLAFYLIAISFKSFLLIDRINYKKYFIFYILFILVSGASVIFLKTGIIRATFLNINKVVLTFIFISFYLLLLKNNKKRLINYFIIIFVMVELFINAFLSIRDYKFYEKKLYQNYINKVLSEVEVNDKNYRFEKNNYVSYNDSLIMNYHGTSVFNSYANIEVVKFLTNNGYVYYDNKALYATPNPIIDSILGLKTVILDEEYDSYNLIGSFKLLPALSGFLGSKTGNYYIYENPNALKIGFMIDSNAKDVSIKSTQMQYASDVLKSMVASDYDYFKVYQYEEDLNQYKIKTTNNYPTYLYVRPVLDKCNKYNAIIVKFGDKIKRYGGACRTNYIFTNNTFNMDLNIDISLIDDILLDKPIIGYYDIDKIKEDINKLKDEQFDIEINKGNYIKGNIEVKEDNILFLSIPYDKKWHVLVDGKKVDYYELYNTFIGLDLNKGKHIIELSYKNNSIKYSLIISTLSLITFIIYIVKRTR